MFKKIVKLFSLLKKNILVYITPSYHDYFKKNIFSNDDNKKIVLFVDRCIPMYDKDAGSKTVFQYINLFLNNGYRVLFIGDDFIKHEPYTSYLCNIGVEVLYGKYFYINWRSWIEEFGKYINIAILNRPYIAEKYINTLRNIENIKVLYFGHDLHHIREEREFKITNDYRTRESSKKHEKLEFEIIEKVHSSYWFSKKEVDIIKSKNKKINAKTIPLNIYSNIPKRLFSFENCSDLLFVGGFLHKPNIDAMIWFCTDIMPLVTKSHPEIKLQIVGSNITKEIKRLESENVIIKGYVADEELKEIYCTSRICVVPLRFGAGVKGKVIEAMYYQLPVITTSIGAEGIVDAENILEIKDNPVEFADEIIDLHYNIDKLVKKSSKSYKYMCNYFNEESALKVFREDGIIK